jgi:hypothetical protein
MTYHRIIISPPTSQCITYNHITSLHHCRQATATHHRITSHHTVTLLYRLDKQQHYITPSNHNIILQHITSFHHPSKPQHHVLSHHTITYHHSIISPPTNHSIPLHHITPYHHKKQRHDISSVIITSLYHPPT